MKKSYDKTLIEACLQQTGYAAAMQGLQENLFVIGYEKGEFVTSPLVNADLFQIVVEGTIHIYYIRDDGSVYSLADGQKDYLLGEMVLFQQESGSVYAQTNDDLTCLALSISENRDMLLNNYSGMAGHSKGHRADQPECGGGVSRLISAMERRFAGLCEGTKDEACDDQEFPIV